jgi:hypothetical protein
MKARFAIAVNEKNEWIVYGNDYEKNHPKDGEMKNQANEFLDMDTESKDINTYIVEVELPEQITLKGTVVNENN